jgi:hypothetical protein
LADVTYRFVRTRKHFMLLGGDAGGWRVANGRLRQDGTVSASLRMGITRRRTAADVAIRSLPVKGDGRRGGCR